jgi:hypothetical protein
MIETKKISLRKDTAEKIAKLGSLDDTYESVIKRILDFYMVHHPELPSTPVIQLPSTPINQLPGTPVTQLPSAPINQLSSTPVTQLPSTRINQLASTPLTRLPSTPVTQLPASKICRDCKIEKPLAEYYLDHGSRPRTICKECFKIEERKRKS